jgi:hypothetical protein
MASGLPVHLLLVRAWVHRLEPVVDALRDIGFDLRVVQVDLEPGLNAALGRQRFDLVIHDPAMTTLPRELIEARLRDHRQATPIISLGAIDELAEAVASALAAVLN